MYKKLFMQIGECPPHQEGLLGNGPGRTAVESFKSVVIRKMREQGTWREWDKWEGAESKEAGGKGDGKSGGKGGGRDGGKEVAAKGDREEAVANGVVAKDDGKEAAAKRTELNII